MKNKEFCRKMRFYSNVASGFSLVEVTLAIGILSFSILMVLGLMPAGSTTMRNAMSSTIETQIVRQISGELLLIPHSQLPAVAKAAPRYFDDEGQEQAVLGPDTSYVLTLDLEQSVYPGAKNADPKALEASLSTVKVVLDQVAGRTEKAGGKRYYNLTVPNSGN